MNSFSVISFINELDLIGSRTSITIVSTQLNGFNYGYLIQIILFKINHLFVNWLQALLSTIIILFNTTNLFSQIQIVPSIALVGFYGISTIVGYLMPNSFYTYVLNM